MARAIYEEQGFAGLDAFIAREELSEAERTAWGAVDPSCLGGEYLPSRETGEVEIARVSLASVTSDQISIRAYRKNAKIGYRIVGEYEELIYQLAFDESDQPLTTRELMELIDGSYIPDCIYDGGILTTMWVMMYSEGYDDAEVARYVSVSSAFYPELQRYYDELVAAWLEPRRYEEREEEREEQEMQEQWEREQQERDSKLAPFKDSIEAIMTRWQEANPFGGGMNAQIGYSARRGHTKSYLETWVLEYGELPRGTHDLGRTLRYNIEVGTIDFDELQKAKE
jgi:hypothetical protein